MLCYFVCFANLYVVMDADTVYLCTATLLGWRKLALGGGDRVGLSSDELSRHVDGWGSKSSAREVAGLHAYSVWRVRLSHAAGVLGGTEEMEHASGLMRGNHLLTQLLTVTLSPLRHL
jgi:hypothetical protein